MREAREHAVVLVAEGLAGGCRSYPEGDDESRADWRIRAQVEPVLQRELRARGWIHGEPERIP